MRISPRAQPARSASRSSSFRTSVSICSRPSTKAGNSSRPPRWSRGPNTYGRVGYSTQPGRWVRAGLAVDPRCWVLGPVRKSRLTGPVLTVTSARHPSPKAHPAKAGARKATGPRRVLVPFTTAGWAARGSGDRSRLVGDPSFSHLHGGRMSRRLLLLALLLCALAPPVAAQNYVTTTAHRVPFDRVDSLPKPPSRRPRLCWLKRNALAGSSMTCGLSTLGEGSTT